MDRASRRAWGLAAVAGLFLYTVTRKARLAVRTVPGEFPGGGVVAGGRMPRRGQLFMPDNRDHLGIDIEAASGSAVYAADDGVVSMLAPDGAMRGYGNTVVIQHPDGTQTLYAHLQRFAGGIEEGGQVVVGQRIGTVGSTQKPRGPMTAKPHLHFETQLAHTGRINPDNPRRQDPLIWLAQRGVQVST